ncbi:MAG: GNAT family N-acetyltransferase [Lachnospirales bacterium]
MKKTVELFKTQDKTDCIELFYDIYKNIPFRLEWLDKENVTRYINDMEKTPNFLGYTLYADDKPVGYCLGRVNDYFKNKTYEIDELFIKKSLQGEGLGTFFLAFVELALSKKDIRVMKLNTSKTASSYEFYGKIGFLSLNDSVSLVRKVKEQEKPVEVTTEVTGATSDTTETKKEDSAKTEQPKNKKDDKKEE